MEILAQLKLEKNDVHSSCLILTSIFENFEHYMMLIAQK